MQIRTLLAGFAASTLAVAASAAIVAPTYLDADSSANAFNGAGSTTDNSGMSAAVNGGDSLASALTATHSFDGGFAESYVSNAAAPDYFVSGPTVTLVYDLGSDTAIDSIILWQYQNNGGGTAAGNHARTIDVQVNTDAQGSASFAGAATTISLQSVLGLGGTNSAQNFSLGGTTGRFVQLTFTDNHFGDPDGEGITGGGDRVGIGEVRFNDVPEPGSLALLGLGGLALIRRRRA